MPRLISKGLAPAAAAFAGLLALMLSAVPPSASAQAEPTGVLRCDVSGGVSFVFGSTRRLMCVYSPTGGGREEYYEGNVDRFGVDVGFVRSGVIVWGVISPGPPRRGALEGAYAGVSAQVAAGAGVGANALISTDRIMLNPISVEGLRGLNVAAGIAGLELFYVDEEPARGPR